MSNNFDYGLYADPQNRIKAERLIGAVVRAFYPDDFIIVMDALLHNSIPEEEIAPRLKLPKTVIQQVVAQLCADHLVSKESVTLPNKGGTVSYCYVDYQHCVDVIRYRLFLIKNILKKQEGKAYDKDKLKCPSCSKEYALLDALPMQCKDGYFACSYCCPYNDFHNIMSEKNFRLETIDSSDKLDNITELKVKFVSQMKKHRVGGGEIVGIEDLLVELKDKDLPRNLPSYSIRQGHLKHDLADLTEKQKQLVVHSYAHSSTVKGTGFGSTIKKKHMDHLLKTDGDQEKKDDDIDIRIGDSNEQLRDQMEISYVSSYASTAPFDISSTMKEIPDATLPDFLRNTRVAGAEEIMKKVDQIQARRSGKEEDDVDLESASKRVKTEEEDVGVAQEADIEWETASNGDEGIVEVGDDIVWES